MQNKKRYISTSPRTVTAKLGKVEIYNKGPQSIRSFDGLSTWSSDHVADKKRYIPWDLWLTNLTEWWVLTRVYYPQSHITCWSRGHIKSYKKWKTLQIHFCMTCGYQTWQKGGLWLGVTCLTTKSHIPLTMRLCEVTWQMNFITYLFYEAYCH